MGNLVHAQELQLYTERFPPFSYIEGTKITGCSTEILETVIQEAGMKSKILLYPWARAYHSVLLDKNRIIFSMVRTPQRKDLFYWIGPLNFIRVYFYKRKDRQDIELHSVDDAANYIVGFIRQSAADQTLRRNSNFHEKRLKPLNTLEQMLGMLLKKRVDLVIIAENMVAFGGNRFGDELNQIEKAYLLFEIPLYAGVNKGTSIKTVTKLQNALDKIKNNGTYLKIQKKYFPE